MRILNLSLSNFGRHAELSVDMNAPVVGVIGANGQGKSTLLEAIQYALCGKLSDTSSAFMRDGGKHGATEVKMEFQKHGKTGVITRRITKSSSSRTLLWEGKEIKAAKEVDAVMGDLLGTDKRAVLECVFVPQGDLSRMLFGEASEREALFRKLTGCGHFDAVAAAATKQAAILKGSISDLQPTIDQMRLQIADTDQQMSQHLNTLKIMPDYSHKLRDLQSRMAALRRMESVFQQYTALYAKITTNKWDVSPEAIKALSDEVTALGRKSTESQMTAARVSAELNALRALSLAMHEEEAATADQLSKAITAPVAPTSSEYAELQDRENALRRLGVELKSAVQNLQEMEECELVVATAERELDKARKLGSEAQMHLVFARESVDKLEAFGGEWATLKLKLQVLESLSTSDSCECPVCATKLSGSLRHQYAAYAARLSELEQDRTKLKCDVATLSEHLNRAQEESSQALAKKQQAQKRLDELKSTTSSVRVEDLQARLEATNHELAALPGKLQSMAHAMRLKSEWTHAYTAALDRVKTCQRNTATRITEAENMGMLVGAMSPVQVDAALQQKQIEADAPQQAYQQIQYELQQKMRALQDITATSGVLQAVNSEAKSLTGALNLDPSTISAEFLQQEMFRVTAEEEETRAQVKRRMEVSATLDALQDIRKTQQNRLEELERQQQTHAKKLAVAGQLDVVAKAFSKAGITSAYLSDVFKILESVVSAHLSSINANFEIRCSDRPLSFDFRRVDEESEWMPQNRLSGGQRVRLSIAMLLALQSVIMPDVGLLVLDEPTTHVNAEGREEIAGLLETMIPKLESTESQLVVCDHCPELLPVMRRKVQL